MPMFPVNPHRRDPYKVAKFRVLLDGRPVAGIFRVSPLIRRTDGVEFRSGSDFNKKGNSPGLTQFAPIKLERGLSHDPTFEQWANEVFNMAGDSEASLKDYRKDVIIELLNEQGDTAMVYKLYRCWVTEYQALPELDAGINCTAVESIVIECEGWERDTDVTEPSET